MHPQRLTIRPWSVPALAALAGVLLLTACAQTGTTGSSHAAATVSPAALAPPPWRTRVFRFVDRSRVAAFANGEQRPRILRTYVRYPGAGRPPFPLVVFAHGYALLPANYRRLLDAWAAAGYLVAAPVFPVENAHAPGGPTENDLINQPGDVRFVITQLLRADRAPRSPLHGLIDPSRIAVAGHSDGGETAFAIGYERGYLDRRLRAVIVLSGAPLPPEPVVPRHPSPPLLAIQGSADSINPPWLTRELFRDVPRPKYLLTLPGAGHLDPYTRPGKRLAAVERVTIAFLGTYLDGRALGSLLQAGRAAPSATRFTADP